MLVRSSSDTPSTGALLAPVMAALGGTPAKLPAPAQGCAFRLWFTTAAWNTFTWRAPHYMYNLLPHMDPLCADQTLLAQPDLRWLRSGSSRHICTAASGLTLSPCATSMLQAVLCSSKSSHVLNQHETWHDVRVPQL